MAGGCGAEPRASQYGGAAPGGEGDFGLALGKQDETGRIFLPKHDEDRGKRAKQNAKQDETGRRVEFTSIRLFCVVPLHQKNGKVKTEN